MRLKKVLHIKKFVNIQTVLHFITLSGKFKEIQNQVFVSKLSPVPPKSHARQVSIDSVDDVMKFLNAFRNAEVATKDKNLEISNKGNVFTFSVAKSKKTGGVYFGDKELIKALGRGFISSGNKMVSTVYNENNVRDAFLISSLYFL